MKRASRVILYLMMILMTLTFSSFGASTPSTTTPSTNPEDEKVVNFLADGYAICKTYGKYSLVFFDSKGKASVYYDSRVIGLFTFNTVKEVQQAMGSVSKQFKINFPKATIKQGKLGDFKSIWEKITSKITDIIEGITDVITDALNKMVDAINAMSYKHIATFTQKGSLRNLSSDQLMNVTSTEIDAYINKIDGLQGLKSSLTWEGITTVSNTAWDTDVYAAIILILDQMLKDKFSWYATCTYTEKYLVICGLLDNFYMSGMPVHQSESLKTGWNVYFKYFDYPYIYSRGSETVSGYDIFTVDDNMYMPDSRMILPTVNSFKYLCDNHDYCIENDGYLIDADCFGGNSGGVESTAGQVGQIKKGWTFSGITTTDSQKLATSSDHAYHYHKWIYDFYKQQFNGLAEEEFDKVIPPIYALYADLRYIVDASVNGGGKAWEVWGQRCQDFRNKTINGPNITVAQFCQKDPKNWTLQDCATFSVLAHFYSMQYMAVKNNGGDHIFNNSDEKVAKMKNNNPILKYMLTSEPGSDKQYDNEFVAIMSVYECYNSTDRYGGVGHYSLSYSFEDKYYPAKRYWALVTDCVPSGWKTFGESVHSSLNSKYFPVMNEIYQVSQQVFAATAATDGAGKRDAYTQGQYFSLLRDGHLQK